jgi:hypothetical protein
MNIVMLNRQRPLWEGDWEVVKSYGRDEPIWVVICIFMETTQGISLNNYLYLELAKMPCISYYLSFFYLLVNWRTGRWNRFCPEVGEGDDMEVGKVE